MLAAGLVSLIAVVWFYHYGFTLYWGDAEAHLNIARRVVEARTTGYDELGSPWLPLPHVLMLPFVIHDSLWRTGLAGAIPSALCFTAAAAMLFASVRRVLGSSAAWCAMALFVLNPNALYLQSIPMTEACFFFGLMGVLFFTARYRDSQSIADLVGAALLCETASVTRYEGWIFIPFVGIYILLVSDRSRVVRFVLFGVLASLGAAWWLFYNWWLTSNPLDFYNGPNSAMAIQGGVPYPGHGDWRVALQYFFSASQLVCGWPLLWIGAIGIVAALWQRAIWPVVLLALWPLFMIWSMHSSAQPIHIPILWPHSWYNTRYALAMLPLLALGGGALAGLRKSAAATALVVLLGAGFWVFHADHENWITWKESERNSRVRRPWTHAAAAYLAAHARPTDTFISTFGDISGIYREAGIHFERTLTWDDGLIWHAAIKRPDLFLWEDWAIAQCGDDVDTAILRAAEFGVHYDLVADFPAPQAQPIEIYRRHEYPLR
ncbi:MAG TPA: hypothetical protein VGL72_15945 [Bryobacteraceae bacterium]